jgi:phosphoglycolate phosphatase-like HAD superfamily hydrolase
LRKEGVLPSEAVYIGDALSDFAAAKRNGVNFVARVRKNHRIFSGFKCLKINDLIGLRAILKNNFP